MEFRSTRGGTGGRIEQAIMGGTAPDGGLYVPVSLPRAASAEWPAVAQLDVVACELLAPFFADSTLSPSLAQIAHEALDFPVPLRQLEDRLAVLELFHGPTAAFKDVGARFLSGCMTRIVADGRHTRPPVTILVATSGDTGGAVAAAYYGKPGMRVCVLFPEGRVSPRQQHQLTCWGGNVLSLAVAGEFDDCQRLAKEAFADAALAGRHNLCSANSINVGRLLPQAAYYAHASINHLRRTGRPSSFIVPTGNLGNVFACVWAREMGLPIDRIVMATNANTTVPDFLATGQWLPRATVATLASAMDVGNPSNMERLRDLFADVGDLRAAVMAVPVSDAEIRAAIRSEYDRHGMAWCPHTATALHVYRQLPPADRDRHDWIAVATAHPAKFDSIVEPLLGVSVPVPRELGALLARPAQHQVIGPRLPELASQLDRAA
ncbi:MAG: threonine synthase [Gammaproteobacteria bacterium]|nr:threonine synthase [Gammaproteobacteria bacterium]